MGGCSLFVLVQVARYFRSQEVHFAGSYQSLWTPKGGREKGTNNLFLQSQTNFANIIKVGSQSALLSVTQSI